MNTATSLSLDDVTQGIRDSLAAGECLGLVVSRPRAGQDTQFQKVTVRPVRLKRGPAFQFEFQYPRKVTHENLTANAAATRVRELLETSFEHLHHWTPAADFEYRMTRTGDFQVKTSPPSRSIQPEQLDHNRQKQYLIPEGTPCPFLIEMGVMTKTGQVRAAHYHKFRQINRFLELVDDVLSHFAGKQELCVLDFGSGKSYLTFALHFLLTEIRHFRVNMWGVDRNPDVIRKCMEVAGRLGCTGLQFHAGDIDSFAPAGGIDLAVSLHACDTATDATLAQAVKGRAEVILSVPCCQHELAGQIQNEALNPLLSHGILRERFAALATDALRAAMLEIQGYQTQIVEFIDMEHTAKNLLIRAVRQPDRQQDIAERIEAYTALRTTLGIGTPRIEQLLPLPNPSASMAAGE